MNQGMIGLEIHVYLVTKEKLFCRCKAVREKGTIPNKFICPICTGLPGSKPFAPNKSAVEKAIQVALMLKCNINENTNWQRKHYSWPDLPKGYQTTISGGRVSGLGTKGKFLGIKIREMHLEEDPASWDPESGKVDYNRSGLPLIEIVTEPDFSTSEEVVEWLKKLLLNLKYLKAVAHDAGIKADVNVNIPGKTERVEIKNVNSLENIRLAIDYELERQSKEGGQKETRRFDSEKGKTIKMRSKEEADDYRFISDPDLPEIIIDKKFVEEMKKKLPETPEEKLKKLIKKFEIDNKNAEVLSKNLDVVEFFEKVASELGSKFTLPWITVELLRHLNYNKKTIDELNISPEHFIELLKAVKDKKITESQAKEILNSFKPSFSLAEKGVSSKIEDSDEIKKICLEVIKDNKNAVEKYKSGDKKVMNFLIGECMKKSQKRADFKILKSLLEELLDN